VLPRSFIRPTPPNDGRTILQSSIPFIGALFHSSASPPIYLVRRRSISINMTNNNINTVANTAISIPKLTDNIITNTSLTVKGTINYISTEEQRQAHHKEDADGHMHMEMANFSRSTSSAIRKPCDPSRHSGGADNCWQLHPELQKKRGDYNNKRGPFNSSSHQSNMAICNNWSH
jgi:hypothetical protein